MRLFGILCLVLSILTLGVVERTAYALGVSAQVAVEANSAQALEGYGSQRAAHPGHVTTHRSLPEGDRSSALCKILCAMAVSQPTLPAPDGFNEGPLNHAWIAAAGGVEPDQVAPGLQPAPPR